MRATTREATAADLDAVTALWAAAEAARKAELDPAAGGGVTADDQVTAERVARRLGEPSAFGALAEVDGEAVALAIATQARVDDGAHPQPVPGLAHVGMVAVQPTRWGTGLGELVLGELQRLARDRGYTRAQLWTHESNQRGRRLYERLGWAASGRTKEDEHGAVLRHYVRDLQTP